MDLCQSCVLSHDQAGKEATEWLFFYEAEKGLSLSSIDVPPPSLFISSILT